MRTCDVVVIGSGHNGLICGSYLARSGLKVLVVERNQRIGGGLLTEQVTLPGFRHNLHANFFMGLNLTPFYRDLELQRHGWELIFPDVPHGIAFPDGTGMCIHRDPEKTAASIARFSRKDADRYREVYEKFTLGTRDYVTSTMFNPPLRPDQIAETLRGAFGAEVMSYNKMTMYEAVDSNFEDPHVRTMFKMWFHVISVENDPGTGAYFPRVFTRMDQLGISVGGSGHLANALHSSLRENGGEVLLGAHIAAITHRSGKVTGVRLDDGTTIEASRAVVSTVDPPQTLRMAGDEAFGPVISGKLRAFKPSKHVLCTLHLALNEPPRYRAATFDPDLDRAFNMNFGAADPEALHENFEQIHRGEFPSNPLGNGACNTLFDPSYAPPGKHVAFWWPFVGYALKDGGAEFWDDEKQRKWVTERLLDVWREYAPNLDKNNVLGTHLFTPRDTERSCINMICGSHHVGAYTPEQVGFNRPTPELSHYRTPVEGLYTGGSGNHVGGSINGTAGYNAANVIADDLGLKKWWTPVPKPSLG